MGWNILHMAAIEDGKSIWPERFPLEGLEATRRSMGSALFECMYMGRPEALSGDIFKAEWFRFAQLSVLKDEENGQMQPGIVYYLDGERHEVPMRRCMLYQFWDLAISGKETADYTCCCTLALDPQNMDLFVLDISKGHWSFQKTQTKIVELGGLWNPQAVGIESVAYQAAAVQVAVQNSLLPIIEVKADKDKVTRSRLPAARAESGKIFILKMPWTGEFIDELCAFPTGKHDDMVDALSGACAMAARWVPSSFELWG